MTDLPVFFDMKSGKVYPLRVWFHQPSWSFVVWIEGETSPTLVEFMKGSPVWQSGTHERGGFGSESRWSLAYGAFPDSQHTGPLHIAREIFAVAERSLTPMDNGLVPLMFLHFEGYSERAAFGRSRFDDSLFVMGASGGQMVVCSNHVEALKGRKVIGTDFDSTQFRQMFVGAVYGQ